MDKNSDQSGRRPPIVTVLGHVDHGKTTLLDAIRKTNVALREAGGITQSIGASVIEAKNGQSITFIDTPGHAAFKNMRSRGANLADIAILVVAADDGAKPQTKEALEFIRDAKIPFIVAATKTDLPSASVEQVRGDLEKEGILFEGRGGDVPLVPLSAKKGEGINELLEMIILVSQIHEVKGEKEGILEAIVIETSKDKRGPLASVVIRNGTLKVGDDIAAETVKIKVRGLFDYQGKPTKEVGPGMPAQILGFKEFPPVGSRVGRAKEGALPVAKTAEKAVSQAEGSLPVVVKANSTGSLEVLLANLPKDTFVVTSGVGALSETDVFLAKAAGAKIYVFEASVPTPVKKLAETEGVKIEVFKVIYELFEKIEESIKAGVIEVLGSAEIIAVFPYENQRVAGCKVIRGSITKGTKVVLKRDEKILGDVKIQSIKKQKQDVNEVKQGEECGILFVPGFNFKIGDNLVALGK